MTEFLIYLISAVCITATILYIYFRIHINCEVNIPRLVITILFSIITFTLTYKYSPQFLRQMIILILLFNISFYYFTLDIKSSAIDAVFLEIICIIAEIIYATVFFILKIDGNVAEWNHTIVGTLISNLTISTIMIIISELRPSKKFYSTLLKATEYLSNHKTSLILFIFFVIVNVLFYAMYFLSGLNKELLFITIVSLFFLYTIVLIVILSTQGRYENIKGKYTMSLENLKEYGEMLNQYRVLMHENKNQLIFLRNMTTDKKLARYIDKLVDNKEKDDKNIYNIVKRIPAHVLRAVIYSKVLLMHNKGITCNIDISRKLSNDDFSLISDDLILDVCNIMNVFIDNAIDEVKKLDKKEILIEFNKNDTELEIAISNLCGSKIDISKIYDIGYSTKGKNRGYGLTVVKNKIASRHGLIRNVTTFEKNIFTQYLYISTKKCS